MLRSFSVFSLNLLSLYLDGVFVLCLRAFENDLDELREEDLVGFTSDCVASGGVGEVRSLPPLHVTFELVLNDELRLRLVQDDADTILNLGLL